MALRRLPDVPCHDDDDGGAHSGGSGGHPPASGVAATGRRFSWGTTLWPGRLPMPPPVECWYVLPSRHPSRSPRPGSRRHRQPPPYQPGLFRRPIGSCRLRRQALPLPPRHDRGWSRRSLPSGAGAWSDGGPFDWGVDVRSFRRWETGWWMHLAYRKGKNNQIVRIRGPRGCIWARTLWPLRGLFPDPMWNGNGRAWFARPLWSRRVARSRHAIPAILNFLLQAFGNGIPGKGSADRCSRGRLPSGHRPLQ